MTTKTINAVPFDPGYAQHTTILSISLDYMYKTVNQYKNLGQRKMKFKMIAPQVEQLINNNVGFCLGCLLWGAYIKSLDNLQIEGNPCLGDTYNEEEAVEEIDFSINFFEQFNKDMKYYLGKSYNYDEKLVKILNIYKEFLTMNKSFVETKTTGDIKLPKGFVTPTKEELDTIHKKIYEVIQTGKLLDLFEVWELAYKG